MTIATEDTARKEFLAFQAAIAPYTVGIAAQVNSSIGSGTLVRFHDRKFILTANHVIGSFDISEMRVFCYPGGSIVEHSMRDGIPEGFGLPTRGEIWNLKQAFRSVEADLALIELGESALMPASLQFYDLQSPPIVLTDSASLIYMGYAVDNAADVGLGTRMLGVTSDCQRFSSSLQQRSDLPSDFDCTRDVIFEYGRLKDGINPQGLSGSGVWCNQNHQGEVWTARPHLAGVVSTFYRQKRIIKAVRTECALALCQLA